MVVLTVGASAVLGAPPTLSEQITPRLDVTFGDLSQRLTVGTVLVMGGVVATYIEPQTDAVLKISVTDSAGAVVTDAVVTAVGVWSPTGTQVAQNVSCAHQGNGVYHLNISRSWSDASGKPVLGEFMAEIKVARGGTERRRRFRYPVKFDDED